MERTTISILGAGKVGIVLAQLAIKAGYKVYIAGSGDPSKIALTVKVLAPGAQAVTSEEAVHEADVVILALPLSKFRTIPQTALDGKLVIDAMNHWWEVDGAREETVPPDESSSEAVQDYFSGARVVKAFSHIGYHELHDEARPAGEAGRKAMAIAGADSDATIVKRIVDRFGFDPLVIGELADGEVLEPGREAFGASVSFEELIDILQS